ncbi:MAG TPA: hypothetical protein VJ777_07750 [Mycobacterium sp.]|nr:hypothetical protein [Mycobacterium sp.]
MAGKKSDSEPEDAFAAAYRAYLESVKQAWAEVDIDELVSSRRGVGFDRYDCAGSVSTIGTAWTLGTIGGSVGTAGTIGCIWLKP